MEFKKTGPHGGAREISVTENDGRVIFDITDKFGIGGGSINLGAGKWPAQVLVRMHLAGLEGFEVAVDGKKISDKGFNVRMLDTKGRLLKGRYLKTSTDGYLVGRIAGYYEVEIPQEILVGGAKNINLNWVDFYRR